jgi:hypothetical protein
MQSVFEQSDWGDAGRVPNFQPVKWLMEVIDCWKFLGGTGWGMLEGVEHFDTVLDK